MKQGRIARYLTMALSILAISLSLNGQKVQGFDMRDKGKREARLEAINATIHQNTINNHL